MTYLKRMSEPLLDREAEDINGTGLHVRVT